MPPLDLEPARPGALTPGRADPRIDVSVIVPAHNAAPTLPDLFASLVLQGIALERLEVIVVDDASTDPTGATARAAREELPELIVLRNDTPAGAADARNQALALARGARIAFLDADDWLAPGHLAALAQAMDRLDVAFVKCDHVTALGKARELRRAPAPRRGVPLDPRQSLLPTATTTMVDYPNLWTGLYSRALLDAGLLWLPEGMATAEDRVWTWRLHLGAPSFAVVDAPGVFYRRGDPNSLTGVFDERRLGYLEAARRTAALLAQDPDRERFMPKVVHTALALTAFHRQFRWQMPWELRRRLVREAARLLTEFPPALVRAQIDACPPLRAQRLAPVFRLYRRSEGRSGAGSGPARGTGRSQRWPG
ncbi:MAG: glycosyltransferase [Bifidobacteriaceae bacterium]|jgi:hypothetical protein|nr:glycosyltransferase [Bifidobacteriaceae bacterium]